MYMFFKKFELCLSLDFKHGELCRIFSCFDFSNKDETLSLQAYTHVVGASPPHCGTLKISSSLKFAGLLDNIVEDCMFPSKLPHVMLAFD
jgi:hypothetical protein